MTEYATSDNFSPGMTASEPLLEVKNLAVSFRSRNRLVHAVTEASFSVLAGEKVGLIGESGSGKSVTARAILGLLPPRRAQVPPDSQILFHGRNLLEATAAQLSAIRGRNISLVFQNPLHSLNPVFKVGFQMDRVIRTHLSISKAQSLQIALDNLARVDLPNPRRLLDRYPHQLSGGQRQRVLIAMAVSCNPELLIADEPTSALDVTAQDTVLSVLHRLAEESGLAVLLITHDMGVVARFCEKVNVMYGGNVVESGTATQVFYHPRHPYTAALLDAAPSVSRTGQGFLKSIPGRQPVRHGKTVPPGCPFMERCSHAQQKCSQTPRLQSLPDTTHLVACHLAETLDLSRRP